MGLKRTKKQNGITLIALVITIIVLLILAAVTIGALTGDNGILSNAARAKEETERTKIIEQAKLNILEKQTNNTNADLKKSEIKNILDIYFKEVPDNFTSDTILTTKEEYGNYEIMVSEIYGGKLEETGLTALDIPASDYGTIVNGYTCDNSAGVNAWKIFYAGTMGSETTPHIYLIADNYINVEYCPDSANNEIYDNGNGYKLSMNDVINDYTGSTNITDSRIQALNYSYFNNGYTSINPNMKAVAYMLDKNVWNVFAGENAEYAIGGPTVEMLMKSYSKKYRVDYKAQAYSSTGYRISNDGGSTWLKYISEMLNASDSTYVISSTSQTSYMWLASPSSSYASNVLVIGNNGSVNDHNYANSNAGFRPIVCLQSEIKLKKNIDGTYTIQ